MLRIRCTNLTAITQTRVFAATFSTYTSSRSANSNDSSTQLCESMVPYRTQSADKGFEWTSRYGSIVVNDETAEECLWKNVAQWKDHIAIECGLTGRKYSFSKLRDHCFAVAYRLRYDFHLKPKDVVAISMVNVPEYAIVVLGAMEAGLTITTINTNYTPGKYKHI